MRLGKQIKLAVFLNTLINGNKLTAKLFEPNREADIGC